MFRRLRRRKSVGAAFDPLSLRPALWLRADRGAYSDGARTFAAASNQWLTIASNSTLQAGDIDVTWGFWIKFSSVAADQIVVAKQNTAGTDNEYMLWLATSDKKFRLTVRNTGNTTSTTHTNSTVCTTGTWYFVYMWHDAANDTLGIGVNGVETTTTAYTGGVRSSANNFRIGCRSDEAVGKLDADVDSVFLTKRILTAAEKTDLYNGGNGRTYSTVTPTLKDASLISWWDMNGLTGSASDAKGSNTLSASATSPTANAGIASAAAANNDYVSLWMDQSGNGNHFAQTTASKRPTWVSAGPGSRPGILFDGVDDFLSRASVSLSSGCTIFSVMKMTGTAGHVYEHGTNTGSVDGFNLRTTNNASINMRRTNLSAKTLALNWGVDNTTKICTQIHAGTHATHIIRVNGVDGAATTYSTFSNDVGVSTTTQDLYLGCRAGTTSFSQGYLTEIIIIERDLGVAEALKLERYLGQQYGVLI